MLLFISDGYWKIRMTYEFQYISCYSLSERSFRPGKCYHVSIHLMLLFIIKASNEFVKMAKFQYISCYSLSTFWTYMNTLEQRFNTSHVTLYRRDVGTWTWGWCVSIHLMLLFIGKELGYGSSGMWVSIHLMLLFIISKQRNRTCEILFQYISCYSLSEMHRVDRKLSRGFNTSHVTLYLRGGGSLWTFSVVSIHLMLLFIRLQDI